MTTVLARVTNQNSTHTGERVPLISLATFTGPPKAHPLALQVVGLSHWDINKMSYNNILRTLWLSTLPASCNWSWAQTWHWHRWLLPIDRLVAGSFMSKNGHFAGSQEGLKIFAFHLHTKPTVFQWVADTRNWQAAHGHWGDMAWHTFLQLLGILKR